METKKNVPLSASRIKTLQTCSFLYYCNYILRLPNASNTGSTKGGILHTIFECLGNPRHKKHYNLVVKKKDAFASPVIKRYLESVAKKQGVDDFDNMESMKTMLLEGLNYDFFSKKHGKPFASISEKDFDIEVTENGKDYRILGFIDKLFLFKNKSTALIRDFKSSKQVFSGDELTDNMQNLMYCLAVKHLYPEYVKRDMEFLFIKFDCKSDGLVQMEEIPEDELEGFEYFLTEVQKVINNFNETTAVSDFAYDKGFPKKEEGFSGKLVCGRAEYRGQLKKDGTPMWHCAYKFAFDYYAILDEKDKVIKSFPTNEEAESFLNSGVGCKIDKKRFDGCPKFSFLNKTKKSLDNYNPFL